MLKLFLFPKSEITSSREQRLIFIETSNFESEIPNGSQEKTRNKVRKVIDSKSEIKNLKLEIECLKIKLDIAKKKILEKDLETAIRKGVIDNITSNLEHIKLELEYLKRDRNFFENFDIDK